MELTPELLLEAKFGPSRRGYDMTEVDEFLEEVAELVHVMLDRLSAEFDRAEANADRVAALEARIAELERAGTGDLGVPGGAAVPAAAPVEVSADEPMRILVMAERTAEAAVAEAKAEAERIRAEAITSSETMTAEARHLVENAKTTAELEARKAGESARRAVLDELAALRADRDQLGEETRTLKRWLDDQRGRMRTTARDLQRLVDDPGALREIALPDVAEDERPGQSAAAGVDDTGPAVDDSTTVGVDGESSIVPGPPDEVPLPVSPAPGRASVQSSESATGIDPVPVLDDDGEPTQAVPVIDTPTVFDVEADEIADLRDESSLSDPSAGRF